MRPHLAIRCFLGGALCGLGIHAAHANLDTEPVPSTSVTRTDPTASFTSPSPPGGLREPLPANLYFSGIVRPAGSPPTDALADTLAGLLKSLPELPFDPLELLPSIRLVRPTDAKPLLVITAKCPTELAGITLPPVKFMQDMLTLSFDTINKVGVLPFDLQQVCK